MGSGVRRSRSFACGIAALLALSVLVAIVAPGSQAGHGTAFAKPLLIPPVLTGSQITLTAQEADVQILDGNRTRMWTFNGTFPGPTIRAQTGQTTQVTVVNNLPASAGSLTIHNHGNHSTPENDGQPDDFLIGPGQSRTYTYSGTEDGGNERGAIQWYHDHRMNLTGRNVWMGLAGMYIIDDPADPSTLPGGAFDVPLIIADRSFDSQNQLSYSFDSTGLTGDHILVNGVPQPYFEVGDRKYRFRLLNASNLRDYELELSNGASFLQIGTDSGLLPAPVPRQRILLGPAERVDVVVDFAGQLGSQIVLRNRAAVGPLSEVMQFRVTQDLADSSSVPATLRPVAQLGDPTVTRTFEFGRKGGQWTINGLAFDPNRIDARPTLGTTEKWVLSNPGGWSHLVHIHDVDQQLLTRNGGTPPAYEATKEVWHIGGGQTVEVKLKATDHLGRYVFHCHVLEHEDDAMMTQFEVVAPTAPTQDTGLRSPAAQQPASGGDGDGFESNATSAFADGGAFAGNVDGAGDRHDFFGYDLGSAVPNGATILGIEVRLDWWLDSVAATSSLSAQLSWDGGASWTALKTDTRESRRERSVVLGAASDTWGRSWSTSELADANFRVRVVSTSDSAARDFFLDWVPVRISYR